MLGFFKSKILNLKINHIYLIVNTLNKNATNCSRPMQCDSSYMHIIDRFICFCIITIQLTMMTYRWWVGREHMQISN